LIETLKKYIRKHVFPSPIKEREVVEAYDIWSENYDSQPGNLMLDLDEILFSNLLETADIHNKQVADIGCGTGRHWPKILKNKPADLTGFDVSPGMLKKLKDKYPAAKIQTIIDNHFSAVADGTYDVILSTLTVAHIENIGEALDAWCRILKYDSDLVITDFHPDALAFGGKRTFRHRNSQIAVRNFVHATSTIKEILFRNGFRVFAEEEKSVDETVKHYYTDQNALHIYDKFKGFRVIYGIHFRRGQ
jgi:ubiquinone/menaquinone biosynthesis C-methylase UbiE